LMWVVQGVILTALASVIFVRWLSHEQAGGLGRAGLQPRR
jgi:hypothetical protein